MKDLYSVEATGDDLEGLLFHFLDEWLFAFSAEPFFIPRKILITEFDQETFKIKSTGYGEEFNLEKHPQGTEVKAITYSAMQICYSEEKKLHELFVIIDIWIHGFFSFDFFFILNIYSFTSFSGSDVAVDVCSKDDVVRENVLAVKLNKSRTPASESRLELYELEKYTFHLYVNQ